MMERCPRCGGEQELLSRPPRVLLHALPELRSPIEIVERLPVRTAVARSRPPSGMYLPTDPSGHRERRRIDRQRSGAVALVRGFDGRVAMVLVYPAVSVSAPGSNVLFPVHEAG